MNSPDSFDDQPTEVATPQKATFWQKLGGGSLSISIIVHAALLAIGIVWVFQVMPQKEPEVDFMPKGGGGGQPGQKADVAMKKRATMTPANAPRVAAKDVVSNFTLPEPDAASSMSSVGALGSSGMSGGLGGSGSGGGKGDGKGTGFGSGMGPGLGGSGTGANPFGMLNPNANALVGTFYNLNLKKNGDPAKVDNGKHFEVIQKFVTTSRWKDSALSDYQVAPKKLYQTRIYMPAMAAAEAPKAFGMTPDAHPRWIVVYRGTITAAKTGKFRFVGSGDDGMAVRFEGRNVFDYGFISCTSPTAGFREALQGKERLRGPMRDCPMEPPVTFYQYPTTKNWNSQIGGMAAGPYISVQAGKNYAIDILITEGYGGLFAASLLMEEEGASYSKAATGSPILPLFRTDSSVPTGVKGENTPPFDAAGPVWKVTSSSGAPIDL